jgi:hypothetical protein
MNHDALNLDDVPLTSDADDPDLDTEIPETRGKPGRPKRVKPKGWDVPRPEQRFVPAWSLDPGLLPRKPPGSR